MDNMPRSQCQPNQQPKDFVFAKKKNKPAVDQGCWHVLVVDDEEDVHQITKMVLNDFVFDGKKLNVSHAHSAREAIDIVNKESFALILLDVVMEEKHSGLEVVEYIRKHLKNPFTRIVMRTGQPGEAPEEKVILEYEINDYLEKGVTSSRRLKTVIVNSLRNYDLLIEQKKSALLQAQLAENLEKANKKLNRISYEKSKFLTYLAHETLTPLNYIGASKIIDRSRFSAEDRQYFDFIAKGSARLHQVIKTIINYFDIIGRDLKLRIIEIPVFSVLSEMSEGFSKELAEKKLSLNIDIDANFMVCFDFSYFKHVFNLLLDNAIKFSEENGAITFKGWKEDRTHFISLTDTGVGLSKEKLDRVFKAYDLENFDRHESGLGLNLPIVQYIIESHQNEITIDSQGIGKGATVTIRFEGTLPEN